MQEVSLGIAFVGGLISFLAPCVLPLIPGFLAYLAGASLEGGSGQRREIFLNAVFFVAGFSLVFAALGVLLATLLEQFAYGVQEWLSRIGGAIIIFFGLYLTGIFPIPFLAREYKFGVKVRFSSRYLTSLFFGAAFAAGWTPCVGPVLGVLLGLAAGEPSLAFWLLLSYALGLGVPFLLVGLFASQAAGFINRHLTALTYINIVFGIILVVLGILIFTQNLNRIANFEFLNQWLLRK